ncbi:MAG: PLP-dependent aminotransferase family protein [Clostridium celatum]|uniref:Transcriptional regulator, GntR family n=1 Tax=Clostridium celatum DSM 1785 TaxID=545697 RepID=L1QIK1_9CLOT|nr:PLP-dependent aminotransferase family protein [Clostridium celatum]EKY27412.1 transcriptional regulator, GntR family [Clostridium celatum DSM 1785]MCE9655873.1 PLP-dependent aminotransferase family protein [Clostridium celatum]MDU6295792.1 PLP-dependent aminotransferase family protein [Clostridium celatum]MDY3362312.1 PLP-dependent aminotransferase family protein [Clostridium celatum]
MIFSSIDFNEDEPIYLQIENYIKNMINNNMVVANGKLPATRELSRILGVSRNSIITAYENLEDEGVVYTVKGKGTFISPSKSKTEEGWQISWNDKVNNYGKLALELDIVKSEIPWEKNLISFKSISPDGELFDMEEFKKAFLNRISIEGHKLLNYGYAKGYKPLMEYLLEYMKSKGVDIEGKDIIITNGFTEGLEMLCEAYTSPGDKIICENPTHNTSIKIMKVHGIEVVGVKMNEDGIDILELEEKLKDNKIKFGYLIPSYHNPTGIVLKGEKRFEVYNLFKKYNVPIIEDGFNEELLYNSTHVSPIAALDKGGSGVVYIGSFSKILFPGIRVGWLLADKEVINILESVKRCKNIHTSFLDQGILYEYLRSGAFEKQIKKVRKSYKERYEFALKCINKYVNPKFIWGEGGLHIYIGIEGITGRELLNRCYKKGVIFTPGDVFSMDNAGDYTLRLGLSRLSLKEIEKGIKIIGEELKN